MSAIVPCCLSGYFVRTRVRRYPNGRPTATEVYVRSSNVAPINEPIVLTPLSQEAAGQFRAQFAFFVVHLGAIVVLSLLLFTCVASGSRGRRLVFDGFDGPVRLRRHLPLERTKGRRPTEGAVRRGRE